MFKIIGTYQGQREEIDSFPAKDGWRYARRMANEYRLAFGSEWVIEIKDMHSSRRKGARGDK